MISRLLHLVVATTLATATASAGDMAHCHMTPKTATTTVAPASAASVTSIPDVKVTTQDGRTVSFYSDLIKDKVVAVNFIFTSCTTVCPPMGALFGNLQKQNADHVGKDLFLVSVSIDPTVDTVERLKTWSQKFGARPGWTLVTGSKDDITRILKAMNVYVPSFVDHQPVTVIGNDATGQWKRSYGFTSAAKLTALIDSVRGTREKAE